MRPCVSPATSGIVAATLLVVAVLAGCSTSNPMPTGVPTATAIGMLGGSAQRAIYSSPLPVPLEVHVTDQFGNSLPGATVTFAASGGAAVAISSATTDTAGNAATTATLGSVPGTDTILARISGNPVPVVFLETATPGPAASVVVLSGNGQTGTSGLPLTLPLIVVVMDQAGNGIAGGTVTWTPQGGTVGAPTSATASNGSAQVTFTPVLGANIVTATVNGTPLSALFNETGN